MDTLTAIQILLSVLILYAIDRKKSTISQWKYECIALGAELPKYEIIGTGLRVYFPALKSALIDQPKAPKHQNTDKHSALDDAMVLRIIEKLKEQPDISQEALGESIGVTRRVVQKYINALKEAGRIERVGGKRYGYWEIKE